MIKYPLPELDVSAEIYSALKDTRNRLITIYIYENEKLSKKRRERLEKIIEALDKQLQRC